MATVGSAIVCDYMETGLFAIVCDPRSFAIIWKPAFMRCFFTDELSLARCSFVRSCRNRVVLPTSETRHVGNTTCRKHDMSCFRCRKHNNHNIEVKVMTRENDPVNLRLHESYYIRKYKPGLNSREECAELNDPLF